eukprot:1337023-Rhodomonas_salina.1
MRSAPVELDVLDCPDGSVLELASLAGVQTGHCKRCEPGSYSNEAVGGRAAASKCIACPAGAICSGGDAIEFALGTWEQKHGLHMLTACPDGYRVLNRTEAGAFWNEGQQCVCNDGTFRTPGVLGTCAPCPMDTYFARASSDAEGSCMPCPDGSTTNGRVGRLSISDCVCADSYYNRRVAEGPGQTAGVCTPCPRGAMCDNGVCATLQDDKLVCVEGSIVGAWEVDEDNGSYELRSCPAGHELRTTAETGSAELQECRQCTALQYILDPNRDVCKACPAGLFCNGTGIATPVIAGSTWVRDNDVLRLESCPTGYAVDAGAGEQCVPCSRGLECTADTCVQCSACQPGTFKDSQEPRPCTACPANTYGILPGSTSLQTGCLSCPVRSTTRGATGSQGSEACLCLEDFYLAVNELDRVRECKRCPQGGLSADGKCVIASENLMQALERASLVGEWARQADGSFELQQDVHAFLCDLSSTTDAGRVLHRAARQATNLSRRSWAFSGAALNHTPDTRIYPDETDEDDDVRGSHDTQVCRRCQPWEYILNSQTDSCQQCPK